MSNEEPTNEMEEVPQPQEQTDGVPHLVTRLQPISQQVGEHVLSALGHDETVAVLTTVTGSLAGQQVISIPLTSEQVQQVHGIIEEIHASDEPDKVRCVGFHCFVDNEKEAEEE